jgi:hypothetical protein
MMVRNMTIKGGEKDAADLVSLVGGDQDGLHVRVRTEDDNGVLADGGGDGGDLTWMKASADVSFTPYWGATS